MKRKKRNSMRKILRYAAVSLLVVMVLLIVAGATAKGEEASEPGRAGITKELAKYMRIEEIAVKENEVETEMESPEYWDEVPLSTEYQDYFKKYCEKYSCPVPFALATAEIESGFRMDVVGLSGEKKIMQLIPGPGGRYYAELQRQTGYNPSTEEGNIACGCYLLGKYLKEYGTMDKASMAYNMGTGGAMKLWQQGIMSSEYSRKVQSAYRKWSEITGSQGEK